MKNFFFLFISILFFISCENPGNDPHLKTMALHQDSMENSHNRKTTLLNVNYNCPVDSKLT
ncbi:MAG TPA: hypothetical protein VFJ43_12390, partial [Bacteroidia bacterium]|nr:hypothetical protein [Bacteroidia bacterium]